MTPAVKKWLKFVLRWGIAVFGIAFVLSNISLRDRVLVLGTDDRGYPREVRLASPAPDKIEPQTELNYIENSGGTVRGDQLVYRPDRKTVVLRDGRTVNLLALDLSPDPISPQVRRLLVGFPETPESTQRPWWIAPADVQGGFKLHVPSPLVDRGLATMVKQADGKYLWTAVMIFPIVFFITAYRWQQLLKAVEIRLPFARTFALNMVGCFYNSFLPGSTGGDVLKAYYAGKQTTHRARAWISVIVDRSIGLIALVMLGGAMATYQWLSSTVNDDATRKSMQVALGSYAILGAVVLALAIYYVPALRRLSGLDFFLRKLPLQEKVKKATDTMDLYRRRPGLIVAALLATFPVHATVVVSAMLCGIAFDLPLAWWYYFVAVPVIVLSGSIPISPQGAGVMEFFAIILTRRQGMTIGQAFALTMSIRVVQMLWNLVGGIFVLKGGYHAPTEQEAQAMNEDSGDEERREAVRAAL